MFGGVTRNGHNGSLKTAARQLKLVAGLRLVIAKLCPGAIVSELRGERWSPGASWVLAQQST